MTRYIRTFIIACAALMITAPAFAADPPCLLDTPAQRAIWDRMKAEQHPGYQQILKNTTIARYNDIGRWEMTAAIVNRDLAMMQRAFAEMKHTLQDFTWVITGNESREYAIELPVMYGCMYPALTDVDRKDFYDYNVKVAEAILASLRPGDSDQATGNYFGLVLMDKVMGTAFLSRTFNDGISNRPVGGLVPTDCLQTSTLRDAVCNFAKVMSVDGAWPEGTAYNGGTGWLYLAGVQLAGIQFFPEAVAYLKAFVKFLMHEHMPGLRNRFEFGDTEHPNELITMHGPLDIWQFAQSLLDEVGEPQLAAMVRQFQDDFLSENKLALDPLYARYYYRNNPYGTKAPWRDWAGKAYQARGQGLSYWRTGWSVGDRATYLHAPAVSNGIVDHWMAFEFDLRMFRKGATVVDHPLGYQADRRFFNTVLVRDAGISAESGALVGAAYEDGVVGYAAGFNAGVNPSIYEGYAMNVPTYQHGQFRAAFQPLDGGPDAPDVVLLVDVVHAQDPTLLPGVGWQNSVLQPAEMYSKAVFDNMLVAQPLTFHWHAPVKPALDGRAIRWSVGATQVAVTHIFPAAPPTLAIVDEAANFCTPTTNPPGCLGGYMRPEQPKWGVRSSMSPLPEFSTTVHCITALEAGSASCEPLQSTSGAPAIGGVIRRDGLPPVSYLQSAVQGPKLTTSLDASGRVRWDHGKGAAVVTATRLCSTFSFTAVGGAVYLADLCEGAWVVEQGGAALPTTKVQSLLRVTPAAGVVTVRLQGSTPIPPPPCTYTLSLTPPAFTAAGGTAALSVTPSSSTCAAPVVTSNAAWASVAGQAVTAQPNPSTAGRAGALMIGAVTAAPLAQAGLVVVPPACKEVVEGMTIQANASLATWVTQINAKEAQGYTFIDAESGKAFFRKKCVAAPTRSLASAPQVVSATDVQTEGARREAAKRAGDAAEVQRLRTERLAIDADRKTKR